MKINNISIQFNYKLNNYKSMDDVPYWVLYFIERKPYKTPYGKATKNVILYVSPRITLEELKNDIILHTRKHCVWVAYPRKTRGNNNER